MGVTDGDMNECGPSVAIVVPDWLQPKAAHYYMTLEINVPLPGRPCPPVTLVRSGGWVVGTRRDGLKM